MKIGIDNYCYHRFMGEIYPDQDAPEKNLSLEEFIDRSAELGAEAVSVEHCFFESFEPEYLESVKKKVEDLGLDIIMAWGHPDGLERGKNPKAYDDMIKTIPYAKAIGAEVMGIRGSSLMFRHEPHGPQIDALVDQLVKAVKVAEEHGIKLAIENHIDFTADEMLEILTRVDSEWLGLNFDTGNFLRLLDDPIEGMKKLAPYVLATHCKDLIVDSSVAPTEWYYFAGVPVGRGLVDNAKLAEMLEEIGFEGYMTIEIDHPHSDWEGLEDEAVAISVKELKKIQKKLACK